MPRIILSSESLVKQAVHVLSTDTPPTFEAILRHIIATIPKDAPLPGNDEFQALIHKSLMKVSCGKGGGSGRVCGGTDIKLGVRRWLSRVA